LNSDGQLPGKHLDNKEPAERVAVFGAGSWGTALAIQLCRNGHAVRLWGHEPEHIACLKQDRENRRIPAGCAAARNLGTDG
jgi:glycerol-3-phosphate dehydrogenase (NAD(P)+)